MPTHGAKKKQASKAVCILCKTKTQNVTFALKEIINEQNTLIDEIIRVIAQYHHHGVMFTSAVLHATNRRNHVACEKCLIDLKTANPDGFCLCPCGKNVSILGLEVSGKN